MTGRKRLTVLFRPILAVPHSVLAGPIWWVARSGGVGLLGATAYMMAIISWFAILFMGEHPAGLRDFCLYYLRWRTRALAYMALFTDAYPPFGDAPYAAGLSVEAIPAGPRDRTSIGLRLVLAIPHLILLVILAAAWLVTTVVAWVAILINSAYPQALAPFGVGVMRWGLRVEAYLLLLTDVYPPFSLEADTVA
jgi:hypothetical protein